MSHYVASQYRDWKNAGLKDFGDFSECIEYVNQTEDGFDSLRGDWFYGDDDTRTIYYGSFGNYNSPGASHYTYADVYDTEEEYREELAKWEALPEYLDNEEDIIDEDDVIDECEDQDWEDLPELAGEEIEEAIPEFPEHPEYEHLREWKRADYCLLLWDTNKKMRDDGPHHRLAYQFFHEDKLIFQGEDFGCSPLNGIDSDKCVASLLWFLSLRPGDTDKEYFKDYTREQMDFARHHGEDLSMYAHELEERDDSIPF